jgi:four helix bundle protein
MWSLGKNMEKDIKKMAKTQFENLKVYQLAEEVADLVWQAVTEWENFAKITIGRQLVNSADSIGANIAEGTGRGSYADNRRFAKIARGSLFELKHWLTRADKRNLLSKEHTASFEILINELAPRLSAYINSIGPKPADK